MNVLKSLLMENLKKNKKERERGKSWFLNEHAGVIVSSTMMMMMMQSEAN